VGLREPPIAEREKAYGRYVHALMYSLQADIDEVAIKPSKESGTFNVRVNSELVFSRKAEGRFPEAKEVKQLVRNIACPDKGLGHSDSPLKQE
jgi:selenoprotein W-related protein